MAFTSHSEHQAYAETVNCLRLYTKCCHIAWSGSEVPWNCCNLFSQGEMNETKFTFKLGKPPEETYEMLQVISTIVMKP
jgi:hypothetical protein